MPGSFQASPIVRDGVMYVSTPFDHVLALDAATGRELWRYTHVLTRKDSCCGPANRGVAVDDSKVYIATIDARLVALDRRNGKPAWEFELTHGDDGAMEDLGQLLAVPEFADAKQTGQTGYSANMAPQVVGELVLVGVTGAGYGLHVETQEDGAAQISVAGCAKTAVGSPIDVVDAVDNGVGLMRSFQGLTQFHAASHIHPVGDEDDRLAAHFAFQLLIGCQVYGIKQDGAPGLADGGHRAGMQSANSRIHLESIQPSLQ